MALKKVVSNVLVLFVYLLLLWLIGAFFECVLYVDISEILVVASLTGIMFPVVSPFVLHIYDSTLNANKEMEVLYRIFRDAKETDWMNLLPLVASACNHANNVRSVEQWKDAILLDTDPRYYVSNSWLRGCYYCYRLDIELDETEIKRVYIALRSRLATKLGVTREDIASSNSIGVSSNLVCIRVGM